MYKNRDNFRNSMLREVGREKHKRKQKSLYTQSSSPNPALPLLYPDLVCIQFMTMWENSRVGGLRTKKVML